MNAITEFENRLPQTHRTVFRNLKSPLAIQEYLDSIPYKAEELDRSPVQVMTDGQAHCLDGGIFAALAMGRIGFRPLILDLVPAPGTDDDHVLAVYQIDGCWGALAKSNYPNLRWREPVHRGLRELVMTYFEFYFNLEREKTLRGYTRPLDLSQFKDPTWMWDEEGIKKISKRLYALTPIPLVSENGAARLSVADERSYKAGTYGTDFNWSFGARP
ncbi:MAG TPA: hypothetical protein VMC09_01570 [Anaerolineales bacterium]|nr:hypothetical protein [Anaerolineales bacterium]